MGARSGYTGFPDNRKPPVTSEEEWEAQYQAKLAAEEEAFRMRGNQPPRHSKVNGPPADWKRWCCLLDGVPVGSCTEFDVDEGWVQVFVIERRKENRPGVHIRAAYEPQRRLYGVVTPVSCSEFHSLRERLGVLEVYTDDPRGEPVPGTEIRLKRYVRERPQ